MATAARQVAIGFQLENDYSCRVTVAATWARLSPRTRFLSSSRCHAQESSSSLSLSLSLSSSLRLYHLDRPKTALTIFTIVANGGSLAQKRNVSIVDGQKPDFNIAVFSLNSRMASRDLEETSSGVAAAKRKARGEKADDAGGKM